MINLYSPQQRTFGDLLCSWVIGRLSGKPLESRIDKPRLLSMGSHLEFARPNDIVCGSGFRNPRFTRKMTGLKVNAVRGPMSRGILMSYNVHCPELYGDIAYLMPRFYRPTGRQRLGVGFIPHENDHWMSVTDKTISIRAPFLDIVDFILSCEILVTSSLYCLMVAEAYGHPAVLRLNEYFLSLEPLFKYCDYYMGTEREPIIFYEKDNINGILAIAETMPTPKIQEQELFDAFWESINLMDNNAHISTESEPTINAQRYRNAGISIAGSTSFAEETET